MVRIRADKPQSSKSQPALSGEILLLPFTIIRDHRERAAGWRFGGIFGDASDGRKLLVAPQQESHLKTADYTLEGLPVFIERKSHDDCIGSIQGGHRRLRAEHERMHEIVQQGGFCCVVIESSLPSLLDSMGDRSAVLETITAKWPLKYQVPWFFAGSRYHAERLSLRIFQEFHSQTQETPHVESTTAKK